MGCGVGSQASWESMLRKIADCEYPTAPNAGSPWKDG